MNLEQLNLTIRLALKDLITKDGNLLDNKVKEECINHRFAMYFEGHLHSEFPELDNLNADLEYNKSYADDKEYVGPDDIRTKFRPDLIIHERMNNDNNLIAFELKKGYSNKKDKETIRAILKEPFSYKYGILISYLPAKEYIKLKIYTSTDGITTYSDKNIPKIDLRNE